MKANYLLLMAGNSSYRMLCLSPKCRLNQMKNKENHSWLENELDWRRGRAGESRE